jgi:membrane protein DedA with SNARE-associated domain
VGKRERLGATTGLLLGVAGVRAVLALIAIPLAPALYDRHYLALVFLRPTKEVLLAGGFLVRQGDLAAAEMAAVAVPLAVLVVWNFFFLGRRFSGRLDQAGRLPRPLRKVFPPERIDELHDVICEKGTKVVFLGRLAVFPSTLMAAAAGAAEVPLRRFLLADTAGAALSIGLSIGAGYALGETHKSAGPWLTVLGLASVVALSVVVGRRLRRK